MTVLLDGNVLVALTVGSHVHHEAAARWFGEHAAPFATTPITQGTLLRILVRGGLSGVEAARVLADLADDPRHQMWPDDVPYTATMLRGAVGHRQVTDAYLAAQARGRSAQLATFDRGLVAAHPDVAELVPS